MSFLPGQSPFGQSQGNAYGIDTSAIYNTGNQTGPSGTPQGDPTPSNTGTGGSPGNPQLEADLKLLGLSQADLHGASEQELQQLARAIQKYKEVHASQTGIDNAASKSKLGQWLANNPDVTVDGTVLPTTNPQPGTTPVTPNPASGGATLADLQHAAAAMQVYIDQYNAIPADQRTSFQTTALANEQAKLIQVMNEIQRQQLAATTVTTPTTKPIAEVAKPPTSPVTTAPVTTAPVTTAPTTSPVTTAPKPPTTTTTTTAPTYKPPVVTTPTVVKPPTTTTPTTTAVPIVHLAGRGPTQ